MVRVAACQTFEQQLAMLIRDRKRTGWSPQTKVALVATSIGFAGITAAYMNRDAVQSVLREQYEFSYENLAYPLLTLGLLGSLGAAGVYLWKRNTTKSGTENPGTPHQPVTTHPEQRKLDDTEEIPISLPEIENMEQTTVVPQQPITTHPEQRKSDDTEEIPILLPEIENIGQTTLVPQQPVTTHPEHAEPKEIVVKPLEKPVYNVSQDKVIIDVVLNQIIGQHQAHDIYANTLTPQKLNPIFERALNRSEPTRNNSNEINNTVPSQADTYDAFFKELSNAYESFQSPESIGYRNEKGEIEVDSTKKYQDRIKDCLTYAETLSKQNDESSQKLVLKAYNKLLYHSKVSAYNLARECIGRPGDGCKAIVQKAFTDLISGAEKVKKNYDKKYEKAANKKAFKKQFDATSDKIMQRAVNFIIACMKRGGPECKKIIKDAFPILLRDQSLSALKFAIYCLDQPNEKYKTKAESFEDQLARLLIFEAECQEKLPGKSLFELMSQENPNTDEKDLLDYALDGLRGFESNSANTLVITSDDQSFGEDEDSEDFSIKISSILEALNSSSKEDDGFDAAALNKEDDL